MDKLIFVGDLESGYYELKEFDEQLTKEGTKALLFQVGDMALFNKSHKVKRVHAFRNLKSISKKYSRAYRAAGTAIDFKNGKLPKLNNPLHFIQGDVEDFQGLLVETEYKKALRDLNIHYVQNSRFLNLGGYNIAVLGGIYSPAQYYEATYISTDDWNINRFFFETEVNQLIKVVKATGVNVDILVTHQGPEGTLPTRYEEGTKKVNWLLDIIKPDLLIHGHHHVNYQTELTRADGKTTKVVGLGNFFKNQNSKLILETK